MTVIDLPGVQLSKGVLSRERIVAAGARIFSHLGYAGTTMRAVADEAGLKAGSLYYHFPSKDELVAAILETGVAAVSAAVMKALTELPSSASYTDRLYAAMDAHLRAVVKFEDFSLASRRVFGQVPPAVRTKHIRERNAYGQLWFNLLKAGRDAGELRADVDIKLTFWFIVGALNATAEWHNPGKEKLEDVSNQFRKLIAAGIITRSDTSMVEGPVAAHRR